MDLSRPREPLGRRAISDAIGLGVLADEDFARIGTEVVEPGTALAAGLTGAAAADLGLPPARRSPPG